MGLGQMQILITGGTGFIGQALCRSLIEKNHQLIVLTRNIQKAKRLLVFNNIQFIEHLNEIKPTLTIEAVINLAGAPIAKYWTKSYKEILLKSRVDLTNELVNMLGNLNQ